MKRVMTGAAAAVLVIGVVTLALVRQRPDPLPLLELHVRPSAQVELPPPAGGPRARSGGMDVTFLVSADTHIGWAGIEGWQDELIAGLNGLPGTAYPEAIGGAVGQPRGLLLAGDLTESGTVSQWARFTELFGLTGQDGQVRYPLFESIGNHDKYHGVYVKEQVKKRHGGLRYSWDWQDLHLVCLGEAPDDDDLVWLQRDLQAAGREVAVVLYFHFPLEGPFSNNWFGNGDYRDKLRWVIGGYRIVGLFHGHFHASGIYDWHGFDVYNVGSVKHYWRSFAVVHLTDERMTVASWSYDLKRFWWWHHKPIFGASGKELRYVSPRHSLIGGPQSGM